MYLRPGGYAVISDPVNGVREADTFTCCHCNTVVVVKSGARPEDLGGWCAMCAKPVCPKCAGGSCDPFEKKLERIEERARRAREFSCW
jgi:hypothetical protein